MQFSSAWYLHHLQTVSEVISKKLFVTFCSHNFILWHIPQHQLDIWGDKFSWWTWNRWTAEVKGKGKGFPYSILSVGPGADPGVQAVSLQVTVSHPPGGRLPLLSARPVVTSPATEHHRPLAGTKLYCLVTEAHRCEQLAQCYAALPQVGDIMYRKFCEVWTCGFQIRKQTNSRHADSNILHHSLDEAIKQHQHWLSKIRRGHSGLAVKCLTVVRETRYESHCRQLCLSWKLLQYTAWCRVSTPLLQCLGQLSLPTSLGQQNGYQFWKEVGVINGVNGCRW